MNETFSYDEFAAALRDQGVEPTDAVLLQNPANFWENLPSGAREGAAEALDLQADPDAVRPTVADDADGDDTLIRFVDADEVEGAPVGPAPGADEPGEGPPAPGPGDPETPDLGSGEPDLGAGPSTGGGLGPEGGGPPARPGEPGDGLESAPGGDEQGPGPGGIGGPTDSIEPRDEPDDDGPAVAAAGGPGGVGPEGSGGPDAGTDEPSGPSALDPSSEPDLGSDEVDPEAAPSSLEPSPGSEATDEPASGASPPGPEAGSPDPAAEAADVEAGEPALEDQPDPGQAEVEPVEPEAPTDDPLATPAEGEGAEVEIVEEGEPVAEAPAEADPTLQEPGAAGEAGEPGPAPEPAPSEAEPLEGLPAFPSAPEEPGDEEETEEGLIEESRDILRRVNGPGGREATEDPSTDRDLVTFEPPSDPQLDVVERYAVNAPYAYVRILYDNEEQQYWYEGREPALTEHEATVLEFIEDTIVDVIEVGLSELTEGEAEEIIEDHFDQIVYDYSIGLTERSREKLLYYLKRNFLGFAKIDLLMQDDMIEDISCDGPGISIFLYHREYESIKSTIRWDTEDDLDSFVIRLAQRSGEHISVAEPLLDATLPDGSRLNASLSDEVTSKGSTFTIRKFREDPFTPTDLVRYGTMDVTMMAFWWFVVQHGASAIYAGGTASGKTTSMNAINLFIPPQMKIVSIEDTREVSLPHENWIPAFTRSGFGPGDEEGQKGQIDMFQLLKAALRQRPEYIIVGEVRGEEAYALFQGMATGHTAYGTMHADSPSSVIHRLESDPISVPRSLLEALDIISVQIQTRIGDKRVRRTKQLVEIVGLDPHTREILTNEVFEWDPSTDEFEFSGVSYVLERLQMELNMTDDELDQELERRKAVIRWMLQRDIDDLDDVGRVVATYYKDRDTLMEQVREDLGEDFETPGGAGLASSDPGLAGEIEADFDTEGMDAGADEIPAVAVEEPEETAEDIPDVTSGGNGHEPNPDLVALADAASAGEAPIFGDPKGGRPDVALDPSLGALARAAGEAEVPPFQPADHPWARRWPPTPAVDDDLGFLAEASVAEDRPPFVPEAHAWNDGRWPPAPGLDADLGAMAQGADPDLGFLPGDHPLRSPPGVGPELGPLAQAGDGDEPLLPYEGLVPTGPSRGLDPEPGELRGPRRQAPRPGGEPARPGEDGRGSEEPSPRQVPVEEPGEIPSLADALGLDPDEAETVADAGYPDLEAVREATPGELHEAGVDPDTMRRLHEALDEESESGDGAPPGRDPPEPGPDEPGPNPQGLDEERQDVGEEDPDGPD